MVFFLSLGGIHNQICIYYIIIYFLNESIQIATGNYTSLHALLLHLQDVLPRRYWLVEVPVAFVELVLELDPVQAEGMEEALHGVHAHEDAEGHPD